MTATQVIPSTAFRLWPSMALALFTIGLAFITGFLPERAELADQPQLPAPADCGQPASTPTMQVIYTQHVEHTTASSAKPLYYSTGLWSPHAQLAGLSELAVLATCPQQNLIVQSIAWDQAAQKPIITDVSPIKISQRTSKEDATRAVISIDHTGGDIDSEFAIAIQNHLATLTDASTILILTPLPGPDARPEGEFPYDWTFLDDGEKVTIIDFAEVQPLEDIHGLASSGYVRAWIKQMGFDAASLESSRTELIVADIKTGTDRTLAAQKLLTLAQRNPYEVVPAIERSDLGPDALMLLRAMNIHADGLIMQATQSEDPAQRALAARAIGNLADVTTDPLGILTKLAEDKDQRVRYEALAACRAVPGRRAAGVAQLVEPYAMTDAMRSLYNMTMAQLLTYGEPVPADSRVNRLRRMALSELLSQERDAIVSTILLERTDLPDEKISEVLGQLSTANGNGPLTALLNLLATMNPQTILKRDVLLRTLANWKANEIDAQQKRFIELIQQDGRPDELKAAAAGALIRTLKPAEVVELLGTNPIVFQGLRWVSDPQVLKPWQSVVFETALAEAGSLAGGLSTKIAALDAIRSLPADAITAKDVARVLDVARNSDNVDLRFAAIRAINNLPDAIKPAEITDLKLTSLTITAVPGQIRFDKATLSVVAGRPVEITLVNPDTMEHNFAITRPGLMQEVGLAITTMNPADAAAINYIPAGDAVLFHTAMLKPGRSETLRFIAPVTPGRYPYVCTFPGHYTSMNGVLEVVAP